MIYPACMNAAMNERISFHMFEIGYLEDYISLYGNEPKVHLVSMPMFFFLLNFT
jgi:hypothetical protein